MTNVGGPLDGTIEFEESSEFPKNADSVYALSRGFYKATKGVAGTGALSAGFLKTDSIISGKGVENEARKRLLSRSISSFPMKSLTASETWLQSTKLSIGTNQTASVDACVAHRKTSF